MLSYTFGPNLLPLKDNDVLENDFKAGVSTLVDLAVDHNTNYTSVQGGSRWKRRARGQGDS